MWQFLQLVPYAILGYALFRIGVHRRLKGKLSPRGRHPAALLVGAAVVFISLNLAVHWITLWLPLAILAVLLDVGWKHRASLGARISSLIARFHSGGTLG